MVRHDLSSRESRILEKLIIEKKISINQLSNIYRVSSETIRKDLIKLEAEGYLYRKRGVAILLSGTDMFEEPPINVRRNLLSLTKRKLADEVIKYLPNTLGAVVGLDIGTTTWHVAKKLAEIGQNAIVTNSQEITELFINKPESDLYCTGGLLRPYDRGFYGDWAVNSIKSTNIATSVLSTAGVKNINGVGAVSHDDLQIKQAYYDSSEYLIVVFDSTKFSHSTMFEAVIWEQIDIVVTDSGISDDDRERIEKHTKLIIVQ